MLRYFEELPYEKIAAITETTVGGAKANFHQALKKNARNNTRKLNQTHQTLSNK